jgi:hypothetical protein
MTMLKILRNVFFTILCFASAIYAGTFTVSGAGSSLANGTYTEDGTVNGYPKYKMVNGNDTFYIEFGNSDGQEYTYCWEIFNYHIIMPGMGITSRSYSNSAVCPLPPLTGWQTRSGASPAPSLQFDASTLTYTPGYFKESAGNDGSMSNSITITCDGKNGESFTGSNGEDFISTGKASVANLPAGLTAVLTRTDNLNLTLSLTGKAASHAYTDGIADLTLTLNDNAFGLGNAANVYNSTKNDLKVCYLASAEENLLINPGAENGYSNWIKTRGGNGWAISDNNAPSITGSHCWKSSWAECTLSQTINLSAIGYSDAAMDAAPGISAGVYVLPGTKNTDSTSRGRVTIQIELLNASDAVLSTTYISNDENLGNTTNWILKSASMSSYGTGVRKIRMTLKATDAPIWNGNYGPSLDGAYVQIAGELPVELTDFNAVTSGNNVVLKWTTATELNNSKFQIERAPSAQSSLQNAWNKIGTVAGAGNSNLVRTYSFTDNSAGSGKYSYRLKQIDYDGSFKYSTEITAEVGTPENFELNQNYPNPFNPSTLISYKLASAENVELKIFNMLGQEVTTLVNERQEAGTYNVPFNAASAASGMTSGIYIARIQAGSFSKCIKMSLLK